MKVTNSFLLVEMYYNCTFSKMVYGWKRSLAFLEIFYSTFVTLNNLHDSWFNKNVKNVLKQIALSLNNSNVTRFSNLKNIKKMTRGKKHEPFLLWCIRFKGRNFVGVATNNSFHYREDIIFFSNNV